MKVYYDIKDMLERELEQIASKHELTSNNLEITGKMMDIHHEISKSGIFERNKSTLKHSLSGHLDQCLRPVVSQRPQPCAESCRKNESLHLTTPSA